MVIVNDIGNDTVIVNINITDNNPGCQWIRFEKICVKIMNSSKLPEFIRKEIEMKPNTN